MAEPRRPICDSCGDTLRYGARDKYDLGRSALEHCEMAYVYGFNLVADDPRRKRDSPPSVPDIRRGREEGDARPREEFKGAIKHTWATAKEAMNA